MDSSGHCGRDRTVSQSASGVEDLKIYRPFLGARTICTMGAKSDSATLKTWQTFPVLVMDKFYFRYFLPDQKQGFMDRLDRIKSVRLKSRTITLVSRSLLEI